MTNEQISQYSLVCFFMTCAELFTIRNIAKNVNDVSHKKSRIMSMVQIHKFNVLFLQFLYRKAMSQDFLSGKSVELSLSYFWNYKYTISPFIFLPPNPALNTSLFSFKFVACLFIHCCYMNIYVFVCTYAFLSKPAQST